MFIYLQVSKADSNPFSFGQGLQNVKLLLIVNNNSVSAEVPFRFYP